jgi:hypothetical protein
MFPWPVCEKMVGIRASVLLIGALCGVTLAFIFSQRQATFFFWLRLEAALCYLTQSFGNILLPQYKEVFTSIGLLSSIEIVFPLWLLIKGVNVEQWEKRALESA